jgi:hypothetical protein
VECSQYVGSYSLSVGTRRGSPTLPHTAKRFAWPRDQDRIRLAGNVGGGGGSPYSTACPSGQVLVGFTGRSGAYVDQIGIQCAPPSSWVSSSSVWYGTYAGGGNGGGPYADTCPAGYAITSITGRSGAYVDAIQAACSYVQR